MSTDRFRLRLATPKDTDEIVDVCSTALDWKNPGFDGELFRWKHVRNPFGESMILVAEDDDGIAAVRPFMSWKFRMRTSTGEVSTLSAVRAVDTATHPRARGQGLFRALTEMGISRLETTETGFVFNTPNAKSLRGYLTMGWFEAGQIEFGYGVRSPLSLARIARSRIPAAKASIPTPEIGIDVEDGLNLIDREDPCPAGNAHGLSTAHTIESLDWRYATSPMTYRFLPGPDGSGLIVRLRQRGHARELVVAQQIGRITQDAAGRAVRNAMTRTRADHCIGWVGLGGTRSFTRPGPTLALRALGEVPVASNFVWQPGDIELF